MTGRWRCRAVAEAGTVLLYLLHDLRALPLGHAAGVQVVISGHAHKPDRQERDGVLYVNPGSAGPRRFQLPVSVARLDLGCSPFAVEFVTLEV